MSRSENCDKPVFLIGCHRSGTTLVRYLIDAHPNVSCPPESKFLLGLERVLSYPQATKGLLSLGFTAAEFEKKVGELFASCMRSYAQRVGKARWVDKTPNYYRITEFIDRMFEARVQFIILIRHPLDTIASLERFYMRKLKDVTPVEDGDLASVIERWGGERIAWARYWVEVYDALYRTSLWAGARCKVVRFEDILEDAEEGMGAVFSFLGEEMIPGLVGKAFSRGRTVGYQDETFVRSASIDVHNTGNWRDWGDEEVEYLWDAVGRTASRFGYEGNCITGDGGKRYE